MTLGADWSNFQPIPTPEDCAALLAAGITFAVVGNQRIDYAVEQMNALRAGGIAVEDSYMENEPHRLLTGGIKRIWVAVETGSGFTDEAAIDDALAYIEQAGCTAGIYTSPYMITALGLEAAFAGKYAAVQRWIADYDDDPSPLGGAAMKQYSEHGQIPGLAYELDLNYREEEPMPELDPVVNADEINLIRDLVTAMASGGSGAVIKKVRDSNPAEYRITLGA